MKRLYLGKIANLSEFKPGAVGPAWVEILGRAQWKSVHVSQIIDSGRPATFAIGVLDTDVDQHSALTADNRIRHIPSSLLATEYADLTTGQKNALAEIEAFLGFPIVTNTVEDVLWKITGRAVSKGVDNLSDLL